jgi:Acetyltransferase (GNAT) domain
MCRGSPRGYGHPAYAASLAEFGRPIALPRSEGWLLERLVPGTGEHDAMGCYPLFSCSRWDELPFDLAALAPDLVSVVFVADPFGNFEPADLAAHCNRGIEPFKEHHVIDLTLSPEESVCAHHRRYVRKATRLVQVERVAAPEGCLDDWCRLYQTLITRHGIHGIARFSQRSFAGQLATPGLVAFRAVEHGATVGMLLWYLQGDVGYYHLGAYSDRGYELNASFALFWEAIQVFRTQVRWLNLGAGAGVSGDQADGLNRFKAGWATHSRTAYLCRHVINPDRYDELCRRRGTMTANYFPAYRAGALSSGERAA